MKRPHISKARAGQEFAERMRRARAAKRGRPAARKGKRNPDGPDMEQLAKAAKLSGEFHGRPPRKVTVVEEEYRFQAECADLGSLTELQIKLPHGRAVLEGSRGIRVTCSPNGKQLYFVKGDQTVDLGAMGFTRDDERDHVEIGEIVSIVYFTSKEFHNFEPTEYRHKFGDEGGRRPTLHYDGLNERIFVSGGTYIVKPEGIVN